MRKVYAAPVIVASGDAIRETKSTTPGAENSFIGNSAAPGSVGFHL